MKQIQKRLRGINLSNCDKMDSQQLNTLFQQLNYSLDSCAQQQLEDIEEVKYDYRTRTTSTATQDLPRLNLTNDLDFMTNPYILTNQSKRRRLLRELKYEPMPKPEIKEKQIKQIKGARHRGTMFAPKYIVPREIRLNPFAQQNVIYEQQLQKEGVINLLNKGLISKDVDISPAIERSVCLAKQYYLK